MNKELADKCTLFSAIMGSTAYGTNRPDSDLDIRGIYALDELKYYFSFWNLANAQYEDKENDIVIYDIRKAFKLMSNANPNIIDLLFVPERFHQISRPEFKQVLENKDKFLSRRVRFSYTGYAYDQLSRIRTARAWLLNPPKKKPERSDFGLPDEKLVSDKDMGAFQWVMANLLKNSAEYMNLSQSTKDELHDANWIGLIQSRGILDEAIEETQIITRASDNWMQAMHLEQKYNKAKIHYNSYRSWKKNRNKKRAILEKKFGYDTKYVVHLVRLLRMGKEILSTGQVNVFREDREELKDILNGAWTYDQVEEYAKKMEDKIIEIEKTSPLPPVPDMEFINELCVKVINDVCKR